MTEQIARSVPKIRFKGFLDDWKETFVGQVIRDHLERTVVQNQYPVLTSSQQYGIVKQTDYFADRQVTTDRNVGYLVLPRGFFSYRSRSDNDTFVFNRNEVIDKGIISYYYPVFEAEGCDSDFFLRRINFGLHRQISIAAEGTGQRVLAHSRFKLLRASFPGLSEQAKIGAYFRELDRLIALHLRKRESLLALKGALSQKMFPQSGALTPEVRFGGYTEDWEPKVLGEICEVVGGGTPSTSNPEFWGGDVDWYSPTEIGDRAFVVGSKKKLTKLGLKRSSARVLPPYKTILFTSRAGIGAMAILGKEGCTNQGFQSLVLCEGVEPYFIYSMGYLIKRFALKNASGSTFLEISAQQLRRMQVLLPKLEEQQKIGSYFRVIDSLIEKHMIQLQKLRQIKAACLEMMLV